LKDTQSAKEFEFPAQYMFKDVPDVIPADQDPIQYTLDKMDEFGIEQVAVETGGKEPTQKGLSALVARAKAEKAAAVFVQAQFPTAAARSLASSIGAAVVPIDDLAPDWLSNLARMGEALLKAARP